MTNLTGGKVEGATRIDSCCWLDGNDDQFIIEFWHLPGSILRTCYDRRTTRTTYFFVPVGSWEFREMMRRVEGQNSQYQI